MSQGMASDYFTDECPYLLLCIFFLTVFEIYNAGKNFIHYIWHIEMLTGSSLGTVHS